MRNRLVLIIIMFLTVGVASGFNSEIEIDKCKLATVEEYIHLRNLIPKEDLDILESFITAARDGKNSYYWVSMWLDEDSEDIIDANLLTPEGTTYNLVREDDDSFELWVDKPYFSTSELAQDFPPGEYTLIITLANYTTVTSKTTIPDYNSVNFPDVVAGSVSIGTDNQLKLEWSTVPGVDEYEVWADNVKKWDEIYGSGNIYVSHPSSHTTLMIGAYAGKYDYQVEIQAEKNVTIGDFRIELNSIRTWFVFKEPPIPFENTIKKCLAKAGKYAGQDMILVLGQIDATEDDLYDANDIQVTISSDDMNEPYVASFPIDDKSLKKGKYNYARTENASKKLFKLDTKNGKFLFMAKNIDLTGLSCPVSMKIEIDDYVVEAQIDEDIVNGPKKSIPIQFMWGVKDIVIVDKAKVKFGKKPSTDSLSIKGAFTVEDVQAFQNGIANSDPIFVTLGSQNFALPGDEFDLKGNAWLCRNVDIDSSFASAKFDFVKCTFIINIKKTSITDYGLVDFGIEFFGTKIISEEKIDLGPKRCYTFWELTQYDQPGSTWTYNQKPFNIPTFVNVYSNGINSYRINEDENGEAEGDFYYYDEIDGVHLRKIVMSGDFLGAGLEFNFDVLFWPELLCLGQTHESESPMTGKLFAFGQTINVSGTASSKITKVGPISETKVPSGTYETVQFDDIVTLEGKMTYSGQEVGTIKVVFKNKNYNAVPGFGVVKRIRTVNVNAKIYGEGTVKDSFKVTYLLISP